ncbi:hypothetical protein CL689_06615 [Candidatus Saccharibacteria bacterium]|nr:hypothetical protein [Candidatus Saccharibacteria bacterium]|tara:strand:- start:902 stop:1354 length:453 start_codon:yes stop_codon:yes gene_type:complete
MKLLGSEQGKPLRIGEELLLQTDSGLTVKKITTPASAARACRGTLWSLFDEKIAKAYLDEDALYLIRNKQSEQKYMMHSKVGLVSKDDTFPKNDQVRAIMQDIENGLEGRVEPSVQALRSAMNSAERRNQEINAKQSPLALKQSVPSSML